MINYIQILYIFVYVNSKHFFTLSSRYTHRLLSLNHKYLKYLLQHYDLWLFVSVHCLQLFLVYSASKLHSHPFHRFSPLILSLIIYFITHYLLRSLLPLLLLFLLSKASDSMFYKSSYYSFNLLYFYSAASSNSLYWLSNI